MNRAIILCSGGLDSVITSNYVRKKLHYKDIIILFFNYNQKSMLAERICSKHCAKTLDARFIEIKLSELAMLSTSLINNKGKIKKLSKNDLRDTSEESAKWYVPNRNAVFLSYALALAESRFIKEKKKSDIFVGFKCEGKESYPDTTQEFIDKINSLSRISTLGRYKVYAPLIKMDKEDIIKLGINFKIDFKKTFSCYIGNRTHCGNCLACKLRQAGFYWANIKDQTKYKN